MQFPDADTSACLWLGSLQSHSAVAQPALLEQDIPVRPALLNMRKYERLLVGESNGYIGPLIEGPRHARQRH
jgi:hypothetical protein